MLQTLLALITPHWKLSNADQSSCHVSFSACYVQQRIIFSTVSKFTRETINTNAYSCAFPVARFLTVGTLTLVAATMVPSTPISSPCVLQIGIPFAAES